MDDLDAAVTIYASRIRLRGLWADFPVVVSIPLGRMGKGWKSVDLVVRVGTASH